MKRSHYWAFIILNTTGLALALALDVPTHLYEWFHRQPAATVREDWEADTTTARAARKITAITLVRTDCYGSCPVYVLRLERGGRATYDGIRYVPQVGRFKGRTQSFDQLAYFAALRLMRLKDIYTKPITCQSTTIVTIETEEGRKLISDYAHSGPNDLLIFCSALDGVATTVDWVADQPPTPPSALSPPPAPVPPAADHP